jgi:hypothetical protein
MYQQTVGYHNLSTREGGSDRVQADGALVCSRHLPFCWRFARLLTLQRESYRIVVVHLDGGRRTSVFDEFRLFR